jgi:hypothetical protein
MEPMNNIDAFLRENLKESKPFKMKVTPSLEDEIFRQFQEKQITKRIKKYTFNWLQVAVIVIFVFSGGIIFGVFVNVPKKKNTVAVNSNGSKQTYKDQGTLATKSSPKKNTNTMNLRTSSISKLDVNKNVNHREKSTMLMPKTPVFAKEFLSELPSIVELSIHQQYTLNSDFYNIEIAKSEAVHNQKIFQNFRFVSL